MVVTIFVPSWKKSVDKTVNLVYNVHVKFLLRFVTKQENCTTACLKMAGAYMEVMI